MGSQTSIRLCLDSEGLLVAANALQDLLQLLDGVVGLGLRAQICLCHHNKSWHLQCH